MKEQKWESQFREWLKEICPGDMVIDYTVDKSNYENGIFLVNVFTHTYRYQISAHKDYLGCTASTRMARAGEDWNRGNDLPDGKFCRETWGRIKDAIIRYELVKVVKHARTEDQLKLIASEASIEK